MAIAPRLKGLNTRVRITRNSKEMDLTSIRDHEIEFVNEIITEGYLDELFDRRDEIFTGIRGSMTIHLDSPTAFALINDVVARASSEFPNRDVQFNVIAQFRFANGKTYTITAQDVSWSGFPISQSGRKEYVAMRVSYESHGAQISDS